MLLQVQWPLSRFKVAFLIFEFILNISIHTYIHTRMYMNIKISTFLYFIIEKTLSHFKSAFSLKNHSLLVLYFLTPRQIVALQLIGFYQIFIELFEKKKRMYLDFHKLILIPQ